MKKSKKLIWQIFPSFLLITLLSLLAVSWYASSSMRHFFLDQTAVDLEVRAILLEKQIIAHLSPLDRAFGGFGMQGHGERIRNALYGHTIFRSR